MLDQFKKQAKAIRQECSKEFGMIADCGRIENTISEYLRRQNLSKKLTDVLSQEVAFCNYLHFIKLMQDIGQNQKWEMLFPPNLLKDMIAVHLKLKEDVYEQFL